MEYEKACFGAGCFWGVQSAFDELKGVVSSEVGFMGGSVKLNTKEPYHLVCSGVTGYAEVVFIKFDKNLISYEELLNKFFELHDPTQLDRQGPDVGSQYRSVVFYYNKEQEKSTLNYIKNNQKNFKRKIVTQVIPASDFYKAEEYHQKYLAKKGLSSCHI